MTSTASSVGIREADEPNTPAVAIDRLREAATAATPGPWVSQGRYIGTPNHMSLVGEVRDQNGNWSDTTKSTGDAAYIAAANPAAILSLITAYESQAEENERLREMLAGIWDVSERMNPDQSFNSEGRLKRCAEYARSALQSRPATENGK